ncbi:EpsG family protein [Vibrio parahaemolyticus]|uniref:EpsG family protein n=1 Tax=Vibrio parahaemolyticus TaxID=670 RepID=UPI00084A4E4E|nr:EpsG family protein [Vibrio parahaemolyticus]EGQ7899948.1 EpsG family protein [Vibrio parahaemolyticus]EHY0999119.1 EpsG family protein [Vibrio parahaemolyticus]EJG1476403.1 EpsG family protein [Vibrio parahaemolyticus]EJG1566032.1 EpsG family protein [Vibrio parahaemolyticus]EKZ9064513.1 EpsG family protein [Vibrio parahaemolyticus]
MIYYIVFLIIFLIAILDVLKKSEYIKIAQLLLFSFVLVIFSGLRFNVGWDFDNYKMIFEERGNLQSIYEMKMEPGYLLLNTLSKEISDNYTLLFFIVALLSISLKLIFIRKYSPYFALSLLYYFALYFLAKEMGQIRQALAVSLLLISTIYIIKEQWTKFFILVCLATSIHISSIVFFAAYPIAKMRINKRRFLFFIFIGIGLSLINFNQILIFFLDLLPSSFPLKMRALYYFDNEKETGRIGLTFGIVWKLLIFVFIYTRYECLKMKYKYFEPLFNIYLLGSVVFFSLNSSRIFAGRLTESFMVLEIIIVPIVIHSLKKISFKLLAISMVALYCLLKLSQFASDPQYVNYKSLIFT